MAGFVAKKVATHVLKENAQNRFGTEDPYFDYVTPYDLNGNPGKVKKTKKAAPPGITAAEAKILKKVTRRAYRLDNCFSLCGIKLGWSAIFGVIPMLGDIFDVFMAMMVYRTCCQADLPASLKSRMMLNIMIDFAVGLIPLLGDVADALYRANTRNAALLYNHLRERGQERATTGGGVENGLGHSATATGPASQQKMLKQQQQQQPITSSSSSSPPSAAPHNNRSDTFPQQKAHYSTQQPAVSTSHGQTSGTTAATGNGNPADRKSGTWFSRLTGGEGSAFADLKAKHDADVEADQGRRTH